MTDSGSQEGAWLHGRFRMGPLVASGALGPIHRAREVSSNRPVLVQVLTDPSADLERLLRDLLEATAPLAGVTGLLVWEELLVSPEGERCLVTDAPGGPSIEELLAEGESLPAARARAILADLLRLLGDVRDHPRGAGLMHLALSPASVFLSDEEPGCTTVQVIDPGLGALLLGLGYGDRAQAVPRALGELADYAAPELCARLASGSARPRLDDRADLFSLGALGYRLVSGRLPHAPDDEVPGRRLRPHDRLMARASSPVLSMASSGARVPGSLASFIDRCLCLDRVQRFSDLSEAQAALGGRGGGSGAWRKLALVMLALVTFCGLGAGAMWFLQQRAARAPLELVAVQGAGAHLGARHVIAMPGAGTLQVELSGVELGPASNLNVSSLEPGGTSTQPWSARVLDAKRVELTAPADVPSGPLSLRLELGARSTPPIEVLVLGSSSAASGTLEIDGWDGELALDPAGLVLAVNFSLEPGVSAKSIAGVELRAVDGSGTAFGPERLDSRADAPSSYELPLDRLPWAPGVARLEVRVTDVLGRTSTLEPLELELVPDALEFRSISLDGGFRSQDESTLFVRENSPSVSIELNRPARVVWHTEVGGVIAPESDVTEWPSGLGHLPLEGLIDPASGSDQVGEIVITAREARPVMRRGADSRGKAQARFPFAVTLRRLRVEPSLALEVQGEEPGTVAAGTRRFVRGASARLVLTPGDELPTRAYIVHQHVTAAGGESTLVEGPLDIAGGKREELPLPLDLEGLHQISMDLFALDPETLEELERPRAGFDWSVVVDRTPPTVGLIAEFEDGALLRSSSAVQGLAASLSDRTAAGVGTRPARLEWWLVEGDAGRELARGEESLSGVSRLDLPSDFGLGQALGDGRYRLRARAEDEAGNPSTVRTLSFEIAAAGPVLTYRWPDEAPSTTPWRRGDEGWDVMVEGSDPNGVRPWLDCTIEAVPEEGLDSPEPIGLRLEPSPASPGRFGGSVPFTSEWSGRVARVRVSAEDLHGNRSLELEATRPLADVVERRYARLHVRARDAGGPTVGQMRLVRGNAGDGEPYMFQGREDALENLRFREDRVDGRFGSGPRSWALAFEPGTIEDFYLDRDEVSVEEFLAFVEAPTGYAQARHWPAGERPDRNRLDALALRLESQVSSGRATMPVTGVTWPEAAAYAKWVGKRLPSLVEHEYAVRGGLEYRSWSGSWTPSAALAGSVRYDPDGTGKLSARSRADVGDVTPEGIRELCGNVAEWTGSPAPSDLRDDRDWSFGDPERVLAARAGELEARDVYVAGASFRSLGADFSKISARPRSTKGPALGFRCALDRAQAQEAARRDLGDAFRFELADE